MPEAGEKFQENRQRGALVSWPKGQPRPSARKGKGNFYKAVCLRMPDDMRDAIDAAAKSAHRSRTQEVLLRLEYTLNVPDDDLVGRRSLVLSEQERGGQS